ncbi:hypothetical protein [Cesiribacter andamanensis]|uniref:Uncharacterized protein n=1 Tax=Cesiribacter andamanensis AMV16 TaxID=1279009 RepID=M7NNU8_9BACT|nr:hypothetical protein [Cesiribacter andamanensis]EMR03395.1 hypothetical protein ADICEAN_01417 [Cesiribacter andamanensis AMV16]
MLKFSQRKALVEYHTKAIDSFKGIVRSSEQSLDPGTVNFLALDELTRLFIEELKENLYYTNVNYDRYFRDLFMKGLVPLDEGYRDVTYLYLLVRRKPHEELIEEDDIYFTLCTFYSSLNTTMDLVGDYIGEFGFDYHKTYERTISLLLEDYDSTFLDDYPQYDRLIGSPTNAPEGSTEHLSENTLKQSLPSLRDYLGKHAEKLMPVLLRNYAGADTCNDISLTILALQSLGFLPGSSQIKQSTLFNAINEDLKVKFGRKGFTEAYKRNDPNHRDNNAIKKDLEKPVAAKKEIIIQILNQ